MSDEVKITGGCLCRAIRFEVEEPPLSVGTCHRRMCQRHTGSPFFVGVRFNKNALKWTMGEPEVYQSSNTDSR